MKKMLKLNNKIYFFILSTVLLTLSIFSFGIGRYSGVSTSDTVKIIVNQIIPIFEQTWSVQDANVVIMLRFPRILSAIVVGAALAVSGSSYQALFSNPMASPDTLGVSSGASVGAASAILLGFGNVMVEASAFVVGCLSVLITFGVAVTVSQGKNQTLFLVLTGMVISSFLSAIVSIIKYIADPLDQLPEITYWLMGSFAGVDVSDAFLSMICFVMGFLPLFFIRWRMNLLSLSDVEAKAIGENIGIIRVITIVCATLLTASSISIAGGIGWVGLVIPHISRIIVGNDYRKIVPSSALLGAIYLLIMDDIARCATSAEIPIGILTAIIGAPVFFSILVANRRALNHGD